MVALGLVVAGGIMSWLSGRLMYRLAPAAGYVTDADREDYRRFGREWGWLTPLPVLAYWAAHVRSQRGRSTPIEPASSSRKGAARTDALRLRPRPGGANPSSRSIERGLLGVLEQPHAFRPTVGNFESRFALDAPRESVVGSLSGLPIRVDHGTDAFSTDSLQVLVGTPTEALAQQAGQALQEASDSLPCYLTGTDGRWVIATAAMELLPESGFDVARYVATIGEIIAGVPGVDARPAPEVTVSTVRGRPTWLAEVHEVPGIRLARVDLDIDGIYEDLELRLAPTTDGSLAPMPAYTAERSSLTVLGEMSLAIAGEPAASGSGTCLLTDRRAVGVVFSPNEENLALATHPNLAHLWGWVDEDGAGTVLIFTVNRSHVNGCEVGRGVTKLMGTPSVAMNGAGWTLDLQPLRILGGGGSMVKSKRGAILEAVEQFGAGL